MLFFILEDPLKTLRFLNSMVFQNKNVKKLLGFHLVSLIITLIMQEKIRRTNGF